MPEVIEIKHLTLTRRAGETIRIGRDVTVIVKKIAGSRAMIEIAAPEDVRILRGEVTPDPPLEPVEV